MQVNNNRKPNRYKHFDYSTEGYYFVTICTKDHLPFFGNIEEDKMTLNEFGKIADLCWLQIPNHFAEVQIEKYIIMPNHIHGIIVVNRHACS
jgi:putative transposase